MVCHGAPPSVSPRGRQAPGRARVRQAVPDRKPRRPGHREGGRIAPCPFRERPNGGRGRLRMERRRSHGSLRRLRGGRPSDGSGVRAAGWRTGRPGRPRGRAIVRLGTRGTAVGRLVFLPFRRGIVPPAAGRVQREGRVARRPVIPDGPQGRSRTSTRTGRASLAHTAPAPLPTRAPADRAPADRRPCRRGPGFWPPGRPGRGSTRLPMRGLRRGAHGPAAFDGAGLPYRIPTLSRLPVRPTGPDQSRAAADR